MADAASKFLEGIDRDFLVCTICMDNFRNAKLLPCLHTFCESCIVPLIRRSGRIKCPLCSERHNVPAGGVKDFPTFFYLNELVERFKDRPTPDTARNTETSGTDAFESFFQRLEEENPGLTREEIIRNLNAEVEEKNKLSMPISCTDTEATSQEFTNTDLNVERITTLLQNLRMNPANKRRVNEIELLSVAEKMGEDWEIMATKLGFKQYEIFRFKSQNSTVTQQIMAMLMSWRNKKSERATVDNLCRELREANVGMECYEDLIKQ